MILVTGASGHLGANLVRRLLADGEEVRVLLRAKSNNAGVDGLPVERVRIAPRGSAAVSSFLNAAAEAIVRGGETGVFTPMYYVLARKPC